MSLSGRSVELLEAALLDTNRVIDPARFVEEDTRMTFLLHEKLSPAVR